MTDLRVVDQVMEQVGDRPENLVALLQGIQEQYRYLPDEALRHLSQRSGISAAEIEGVASFYAQFRRQPVGKHLVKVCHGTACHVKGADLVDDALRRHLGLREGEDTDKDGNFTLEKVACVGCCSLAPVVVVDDATYGGLTAESAPKVFAFSNQVASSGKRRSSRRAYGGDAEIRIATDSCCEACGALSVKQALEDSANRFGFRGRVRTVACTGACHLMPMAEVVLPGEAPVRYPNLHPEDAETVVRSNLRGGWLQNLTASWFDRLVEPEPEPLVSLSDPRDPVVCATLGQQRYLAMEGGGRLPPLDLDAYIASGGFAALEAVRQSNEPAAVIQTILDSGIRGRGGAGFPTGRKWRAVREAPGDTKYLIVNGDEGDPGAFMDRMLLESFPFRVLEGVAIAAFAMGIREGVLYIRAEYPRAIASIRAAIAALNERGLLGDLKLRIVQGAGAFVCGEETALIASVEGKRGLPRLRPPYPAQSGLWGKPTCVNNVETYALVPWIVRNGADAFSSIGTASSKGTKVFALAGAVRRGGLIEVPMGTTIRQIVETIGGGVAEGRTFKAVLVGGPSGGCVPASLADTPVDYEALQGVGAIVGSGGLVVLDDRSCMVDVARYFMRFTQNESCGKCTLCRVGTRRMLDILDRICEGQGRPEDIPALEELAMAVTAGSLCGLGQTAPNPVLSTLRHFREEYEAHVQGRCPAGRCTKLIRYDIDERCIGCTRCAQVCPTGAIELRPHERHVVRDDLCVKCDSCRLACPEEAVHVV